jgi:hypothetical protein
MDKYFMFLLLFAVAVFSGCEKKNYGHTIDELKEEVEYTQEEIIRGFHDDKSWKINTIEINDTVIHTVHYSATVVEDYNTLQIGDTIYAFMHGFLSFNRDYSVRLNVDFRVFDAGDYNRHHPLYIFPEGLNGTWEYDEGKDQISIDNFSVYNHACDTVNLDDCEIPYSEVSSVILNIEELSKEKLTISWFDPWLVQTYTMYMEFNSDQED